MHEPVGVANSNAHHKIIGDMERIRLVVKGAICYGSWRARRRDAVYVAGMVHCWGLRPGFAGPGCPWRGSWLPQLPRLPSSRSCGCSPVPSGSGTARAIDLAIGACTEGRLFAPAAGKRLDRHGAARIARIVGRVTRRAGIARQVSPHTLRQVLITSFDAGVLPDIQDEHRGVTHDEHAVGVADGFRAQ
jgi:hypothetical protein